MSSSDPWADEPEPEYEPGEYDGEETDPELYAHLPWGDDGLNEPAIREAARAIGPQINADHPLASGLVMAGGQGWEWVPELGRYGIVFDGTADFVHTN